MTNKQKEKKKEKELKERLLLSFGMISWSTIPFQILDRLFPYIWGAVEDIFDLDTTQYITIDWSNK